MTTDPLPGMDGPGWLGGINPPDGDRDGNTYDARFDRHRLNRQAKAVATVMADHGWHTLYEIARVTGEPEASISARLRDLRKPKFGSWTVERQRMPFNKNVWEYRVLPKPPPDIS